MIIQYLIVFAIVIVAAVVVIKKMAYQTKGHGCQGCNCSSKSADIRKLVKTKPR
jgi:hypothetical protein